MKEPQKILGIAVHFHSIAQGSQEESMAEADSTMQRGF
jgi:hypothetical protein